MYFIDIYNRKILPNDYLLINKNGAIKINMSKLMLVQVDDNLECRYVKESPLCLACVHCYKIENISAELLSYLDKPNEYKLSLNTIKDIYNRNIKAGDFVYSLSYNYFKKNELVYGLVIDSNHIFTDNNTIKKVSNVFKIDSCNQYEEIIYNELVYNYNDYLRRRTFHTDKKLEVGDVFETNSYLHIYCGDYMFSVYSDEDYMIRYSNSILDSKGKPHQVFLKLKKSVTKHMDFYRDYSYGWIGEKDMSDFISSCGLSNSSLYSLGLPNCYKFDLSISRLGVFKENIGICRRPDSEFLVKYGNRKIRVNFYFNYYY